jgi:hypothetical protein
MARTPEQRAREMKEALEFLDSMRVSCQCKKCGRANLVYWYKRADGSRAPLWEEAINGSRKWFLRVRMSNLVPLCDDCAPKSKADVNDMPELERESTERERKPPSELDVVLARKWKLRALNEKDQQKRARYWAYYHRFQRRAEDYERVTREDAFYDDLYDGKFKRLDDVD